MGDPVRLSEYVAAAESRLATAHSEEERQYLDGIIRYYKDHRVVDTENDGGVLFDLVEEPMPPVTPPRFAEAPGQASQATRQGSVSEPASSRGATTHIVRKQRPSLDIQQAHLRKAPGGAALPPRPPH
jgi:hypothetical protein